MNESCRYDYKHSISKDLVEYVDGLEIVRARRVSITYRDMSVDDQKAGGDTGMQSSCGSSSSSSSSSNNSSNGSHGCCSRSHGSDE